MEMHLDASGLPKICDFICLGIPTPEICSPFQACMDSFMNCCGLKSSTSSAQNFTLVMCLFSLSQAISNQTEA